MSSWHSYSQIFNFGHRAVSDILKHGLNIEEKVDGSQFSFGYFPDDESGIDLKVRSKGAVMVADAPEKMFTKAVESVKERLSLLHPGWTYRGEYLAKPKHNSLVYDRVPTGYIMLFDVTIGEEEYLSYEEKAAEATRIGLEVVPRLFTGRLESIDQFRSFLDTCSVLGGQRIEGVVAKPVGYGLFGLDKKVIMAKFVSEAFKEVHRKTWKADNPTSGDILTRIGDVYGTPARWNKSIQHLRERGLITDSPKDIGILVREIQTDIFNECYEEIVDDLMKWAKPHLTRKFVSGFPQYYKEQLLKRSFDDSPEQVGSLERIHDETTEHTHHPNHGDSVCGGLVAGS